VSEAGDDPRPEWRRLAREPAVATRFLGLRTLVEERIARERPLCLGGGQCCRFERYGHRLFVTGLEATFCLARMDRPAPDPAEVEAARARGDCPFLARRAPFVGIRLPGVARDDRGEGGLCGVHAERPLGCRLFHCDPRAEAWERELHEEVHEAVRGLHRELAAPYRYLEWRDALALLVG